MVKCQHPPNPNMPLTMLNDSLCKARKKKKPKMGNMGVIYFKGIHNPCETCKGPIKI